MGARAARARRGAAGTPLGSVRTVGERVMAFLTPCDEAMYGYFLSEVEAVDESLVQAKLNGFRFFPNLFLFWMICI